MFFAKEVADVVSFIRTSWGNQGKAVNAAEVKEHTSAMPVFER